MLLRQAALLLSLLVVIVTAAGAGQGGDAAEEARLLAGVIDIHVHSNPDSRPRSLDALGRGAPGEGSRHEGDHPEKS